MRFRALLILTLALGALAPLPPSARAQEPPAIQPQVQPQEQTPEQTGGVGRISQIQGAVSTQRGDSGDWSAATVNTPVVPGDRISTGEHSRAEIQLDYANILRLEANSVVRVTELAEGRIQIQVAQGLVSFDGFPNANTDVEIDTPNLAIHPRKDGSYRVQVSSDGETLVTVRRGQAEVGTAEGSTVVEAGQIVTVRGDSGSAQYRVSNAPARDGFDFWNDERDQYIQRAQAAQSQDVNPYYTGSADLNANGTWQNAPDYGPVWTPNNVPADWAPYRDGSWLWEPNWGWTWASSEPWGWAPYHYGRWFLQGARWAWWPGPVTPFFRPVWAPAYVSFFGFGGGGFGFGSFGWLPIGPGDFFFPWWGIGRGFSFVSFNFFFHGGHGWAPLGGIHGRSGFSNINGMMSNARLRSGITSVAAGRFGGRVMPQGRAIGAEEMRGAQFARGNLPVAPTRGSLSASGRPASAGTVPSRNLGSQHFFSHNQAAATQHSFAADAARMNRQIEQQRGSGTNGESRPFSRESSSGASSGVGRQGEQPRSNFRPDTQQPQGRAPGNPTAERGNWNAFQGSHGTSPQTGVGAERNLAQPRGTGPVASAQQPRSYGMESNGGWQHFSAQNRPGGEMNRGPASNAPRTQARPQLDLHQSIVQQRVPANAQQRAPSNGPSSYGPGGGGYHPSPQSSYAAPRSQPSARAPEAPRGSPAAPHYSAPPAAHNNHQSFGGGGGGNRGGGSSHPSSHSSGGHSGHH
ncbi:MAG TPA: FecR family protein [Candidatus Acidoferrales bacterium]|nr:FecR family protein [Candidatus Acidoferrales bacterium]